MEAIIAFMIDNLETVVAVTGGIGVALFIFIGKSGSGENDLTPLYIKYKRHQDNLNRSTKSIL